MADKPSPRLLFMSLLVWLTGVAIWMTWAPFEWRTGDRSPWEPELEFDYEMFGHFVFLMPVAVVLAAWVRRRTLAMRCVLLAAVTLLAAVLELAQWWIAIRAVSPYDFAAGVVGATLAFGLAELPLRYGINRRRLAVGTGLSVFLFVLFSFSYSVARQHAGLTLAGWKPFPATVGDEIGGKRRFVGEIHNPQLCAGLPQDELCFDPSVQAQAGAQFIDRVIQSQRVRVAATVNSERENQSGPARIVTMSDGPYFRNLTLGQAGRDLVLRLRTERAGINGIHYTFVLRQAVEANEETQVEAVFERGHVAMLAVSSSGVRRGSFTPLLRYSLRVRGSARPQFHVFLKGRALLVGSVLFFSGISLVWSWLWPTSRWTSWVVGPVLSVLYLLGLDAGLGGALSPGAAVFGLAVAASLLGSALGATGWLRAPRESGTG